LIRFGGDLPGSLIIQPPLLAKLSPEYSVVLFRKGLATRVAAPAILALLIVAVTVAALLSWSAGRTDGITRSWQRDLASGFVDKLGLELGVITESEARWDEAVRKTHRPILDLDWLDAVFGPASGIWHVHFESYLIDSNDRPYYAADMNSRRNPARFATRAGVVIPLVTELRKKMLKPTANIDYGRWKTPGIADIRNIDGEPVIVVLKPVVSDTGKIVQKPDTEHVYVYLYWLDQTNLKKWAKVYHLNGVRFSWTSEVGSNEISRPILSSRTKRPAGYFVWQPYQPGTIVLRDMILPLLGGFLLISLITWSLIRKVLRSTTELMASEAQAKHLAFHDALTGLPNRALFEDRLERALAATRRDPDAVVALLYLDLDRFKKVNDTLGHPAGDELLREVAKRLTDVVRASDTVARLGGDEFAILDTQLESERDIRALCERIIQAINAPFDLIGSQVFVGISIGVARSDCDGLDRTELSRKADIALYGAKAEGRGRFAIFAEEMDTTIQVRRTMEGDLRSALTAGDQLKVWYQPKYDATSKSIVGIEALVRWKHPEKGLLSPTTFVPIAEETGLIEPIGEWVLEKACAAAVEWPSQTISVNVSAVQLRNPFFAHRVLQILGKTELDPARLELEITETSFMESIESCIPNLKMLRAVGIRVALDDFGTGYSSFAHLRSFDVDRIKIDKSFTLAIDNSGDSNAIIKAIVDLAHSTGIQITAEGVETTHQSQFLSAVGCDELQGFLMSRPLSLKAMDALLGIARRPNKQAIAA
jgi:diguanylate cyclase (GGDEF)-like protein